MQRKHEAGIRNNSEVPISFLYLKQEKRMNWLLSDRNLTNQYLVYPLKNLQFVQSHEHVKYKI